MQADAAVEQAQLGSKAKRSEIKQKAREAAIRKLQLIGLLVFCLAFPAAVLLIQSNRESDTCSAAQKKCHDKCVEMFKDTIRIYASQMIPEEKCIADCDEVFDSCQAGANALTMSAVLLGVGLGVALCLIWLLQAIMSSSEEDVAGLANKKPRAAYVEPVFTEEEKVKAQLKKKKKAEEVMQLMSTTDAKCPDCDITIPVSSYWLPENACSKGGLESSICPRCRRPIVGIL
jgi:hypothetical protein